MIALFVACAMFWAGFEQTGSSLNLFADRYTDRNVFGWNMPAGVLQNINPFFIILFSPVFAALWVNLGRRNLDLSAPAKFALGLILMGVGFVVMYFAAQYVVQGQKVLPTVAHPHLYVPHVGRAVPVSRGVELHVEACAPAFRRPGAGHLVPGDGHRQQPRRADRR